MSYVGVFGPTDLRKWNSTAQQLQAPSEVSVYLPGTSTPAELFTASDGLTDATNNPVTTGVAVGSTGLDVDGNLMFYAAPGHYDYVADGERFPCVVYHNPDDVAAALAASSSGGGQAGNILTLGSDAISVSGDPVTGQIVMADFTTPLVPGDPGYRFAGQVLVYSTSAAGFAMSIIGNAGAQDADLSFRLWGPNGGSTATPNLYTGYGGAPTAGQYNAFASGGSWEILDFSGSARVLSGKTAQNLLFRMHQQTTTASVNTTVKAWHSFVVMRPSLV